MGRGSGLSLSPEPEAWNGTNGDRTPIAARSARRIDSAGRSLVSLAREVRGGLGYLTEMVLVLEMFL